MAIAGATPLGVDQTIRGITGFAAGGFAAADTVTGSGNDIDTASVKVTLKHIVGPAGDYLSAILANATGNGEADALSNLNQHTIFTHATSQFYEDSTILQDQNNDNSSFVAAFDGFAENIV
ncbi:hypothetical protein N7492_005216 [Penicillium capsulatum]|uniref:Uncharacterized protein n=1 Tax=Penicillium capsulatum TaxID=69766 RepID=A0A9W9IBJ1_9EURO|nr:hypothetical protein N7492_005216 [Penicillium capsulatum]KAJ6135679.1 hypothetical protein N7512_000839 [Penicillium capsulatum]